MKKSLIAATTGAVAVTVLMLCSASAMAHGRVDWSVSIGAPPVYYPPPVVYSAPQVVYEEPAPVYRVPAPVVRYEPQPYYVAPAYGYRDPYWRQREWREHEWRERHRHHRHHDDD